MMMLLLISLLVCVTGVGFSYVQSTHGMNGSFILLQLLIPWATCVVGIQLTRAKKHTTNVNISIILGVLYACTNTLPLFAISHLSVSYSTATLLRGLTCFFPLLIGSKYTVRHWVVIGLEMYTVWCLWNVQKIITPTTIIIGSFFGMTLCIFSGFLGAYMGEIQRSQSKHWDPYSGDAFLTYSVSVLLFILVNWITNAFPVKIESVLVLNGHLVAYLVLHVFQCILVNYILRQKRKHNDNSVYLTILLTMKKAVVVLITQPFFYNHYYYSVMALLSSILATVILRK